MARQKERPTRTSNKGQKLSTGGRTEKKNRGSREVDPDVKSVKAELQIRTGSNQNNPR